MLTKRRKQVFDFIISYQKKRGIVIDVIKNEEELQAKEIADAKLAMIFLSRRN